MLDTFYREGREIAKSYGVNTPFTIKTNGRFVRLLGQYRTGSKTIEISSKLIRQEGWSEARRTFLHELAHHIAWCKYGYYRHGKVFLDICLAIGGSCGKHQMQVVDKSKYAEISSIPTLNRGYTWICDCGSRYSHKTLKYNHGKYQCRNCKKLCKDMKVVKT
jgi:predicted SprT family Zn-dependent metalloprotease